jgi:hypothetical protein
VFVNALNSGFLNRKRYWFMNCLIKMFISQYPVQYGGERSRTNKVLNMKLQQFKCSLAIKFSSSIPVKSGYKQQKDGWIRLKNVSLTISGIVDIAHPKTGCAKCC